MNRNNGRLVVNDRLVVTTKTLPYGCKMVADRFADTKRLPSKMLARKASRACRKSCFTSSFSFCVNAPYLAADTEITIECVSNNRGRLRFDNLDTLRLSMCWFQKCGTSNESPKPSISLNNKKQLCVILFSNTTDTIGQSGRSLLACRLIMISWSAIFQSLLSNSRMGLCQPGNACRSETSISKPC